MQSNTEFIPQGYAANRVPRCRWSAPHPAVGAVAAEVHETPVIRAALQGMGATAGGWDGWVQYGQQWLPFCGVQVTRSVPQWFTGAASALAQHSRQHAQRKEVHQQQATINNWNCTACPTDRLCGV